MFLHILITGEPPYKSTHYESMTTHAVPAILQPRVELHRIAVFFVRGQQRKWWGRTWGILGEPACDPRPGTSVVLSETDSGARERPASAPLPGPRPFQIEWGEAWEDFPEAKELCQSLLQPDAGSSALSVGGVTVLVVARQSIRHAFLGERRWTKCVEEVSISGCCWCHRSFFVMHDRVLGRGV